MGWGSGVELEQEITRISTREGVPERGTTGDPLVYRTRKGGGSRDRFTVGGSSREERKGVEGGREGQGDGTEVKRGPVSSRRLCTGVYIYGSSNDSVCVQ